MLIPVGTALLFPASSSLVSRFAQRHDLPDILGRVLAGRGVGPACAAPPGPE